MIYHSWIFPFSSTLGWHSLKVKGEVQTRKGLRWIPRHLETRKGVVSDEMRRGVERPKPKYIGQGPTQQNKIKINLIM